MLDNIVARASIGRATDPVARVLVRHGVAPDLVTVLGTVGTVAAAVWFLPRGQLFVGTCVVTAFVLFDLLDGAMARVKGTATAFGAVLDSTCDRIADGALFAGLAWWCLRGAEQPDAAGAALVSLVAGQVVSYLKARAEASGLSAQGGLVERAERLILALVGAGLEGLGVPQALRVALWLLAVGSGITLAQRLFAVWRSARAQVSPPSGPGDPGPGDPGPGVPGPGVPGTVVETDGEAEAGAAGGVDGR